MVSGYNAKKLLKWPTFDKVTVKIKVAQLFLTHSVYYKMVQYKS